MSISSPEPPRYHRTELETVVHWPMIVSAGGTALFLLAVLLVLAGIARRGAGPELAPVAARQGARPTLEPVDVAPIAPPVRPIVAASEPAVKAPPPIDEPRPIRVKVPPQPLPPVTQVSAPPGGEPVAVRANSTPRLATAPIVSLSKEEPPAPPSFKRRDVLPEEDLLRDLQRQVKELDLDAVKGASADILARAKTTEEKSPRDRSARGGTQLTPRPAAEPVLALLAQRADLKGLPVRKGTDCQVSWDTARKRGALSVSLRRLQAGRPASSQVVDWYHHEDILKGLKDSARAITEETLSTAVQMLQVESPLTRRHLIKLLAEKPQRQATVLLARQALFDFAPEVREAAIKALKTRPLSDCRPVLLDGLRYPWAPVADHAAEALVALNDRDAASQLVGMLDEPDPCAPRQDRDQKWVVSEMVRVNHLRNCLLCHAPSFASDDPVRGMVPTPGQPLPRVYYASKRGTFVRADITYLRQDFSLIQPAADHGRWPLWQRYDYLVRSRELTADERTALNTAKGRPEPVSYPQRNAVLFALRELTGMDGGDFRADWDELLWGVNP